MMKPRDWVLGSRLRKLTVADVSPVIPCPDPFPPGKMSWLREIGLMIAVQALCPEVCTCITPGFPAWNELGLYTSPPHPDMLSVVFRCKDVQVGTNKLEV